MQPLQPYRLVPTKSYSAPDMQSRISRHNSLILNSRSASPSNTPVLMTEVEMDSDRPLQIYPDDSLVKTEDNQKVATGIRFVLAASAVYAIKKRIIFTNAISYGYKRTLGALLNDIRRAGGVINLESADLSNLDLRELDLHGMTAQNASFAWSDLSGSNLTHSNLICTDLSNVTARETRFDQAVFNFTVVSGMTTDNRWIIRKQVQHTDAYPNRSVTHIYVEGTCPTDQIGPTPVTLPAPRTVYSSCCSCVIL